MRNERKITLTKTEAKISYAALVTAITEKIKDGGEFVVSDNMAQIKKAIEAAEK